MFRRAVFALVLVGAAFGGGAAINGPGLAWLKQTFAGGPTIIVDGAPAPSSAPKGPLKQFPTANTPPLQFDIPRAPAAPAKKKAAPAVELAQADPPLLPESPSTPASALAPLPNGATPEGEPSPPPASASASVAIAQAPPGLAPERATLPPLDPSPPPKSDPVARLASVESPSPPPTSSPSKDWADLRGRMKSMGIGRYTIEGETDGRVRFSCIIPVDGLRAVGHHFEAEGDDEFQAAEAALKRIALWKATSPQD